MVFFPERTSSQLHMKIYKSFRSAYTSKIYIHFGWSNRYIVVSFRDIEIPTRRSRRSLRVRVYISDFKDPNSKKKTHSIRVFVTKM